MSLAAEIVELQRRESEGEAALLVRERVEARLQSDRPCANAASRRRRRLATARSELETLRGRSWHR